MALGYADCNGWSERSESLLQRMLGFCGVMRLDCGTQVYQGLMAFLPRGRKSKGDGRSCCELNNDTAFPMRSIVGAVPNPNGVKIEGKSGISHFDCLSVNLNPCTRKRMRCLAHLSGQDGNRDSNLKFRNNICEQRGLTPDILRAGLFIYRQDRQSWFISLLSLL